MMQAIKRIDPAIDSFEDLTQDTEELTEAIHDKPTQKLVCRWVPTGRSYPKMEARWEKI